MQPAKERRGVGWLLQKEYAPYLVVFLVPLLVRLIPELEYSYPLGADTPTYMYVMKYGVSGLYQQTNVFYQLIASLGKLGTDPQLFFKVYPPLTFALTALLLGIFARRSLKWDARAIVIFGFVYSLVPALLRTSWDLQRQDFAMLLLALALVVDTLSIDRKWKWGTTILLYAAIGLTHELVFGVALAIQAWKILSPSGGLRTLRSVMIPVAVVALALGAYVVIRFSTVQGLFAEVFTVNYQPLGITFASPWERVDWGISVGILSFGLILPLSILGYFRNKVFAPWLLMAAIPYLSFLISYVSFNFPDRWLYLAGIPMAFYASKFLRGLNPRSLAIYGVIGLLAIQPLSMIGGTPLPLSLYADKRYGTFTDLLATSIPEAQITAIRTFSQTSTEVSTATIIVPYALVNWVAYYLPKANVLANDSTEAGIVTGSSTRYVYVSFSGITPNIGNLTLVYSYGGLDFYEAN
jgi:hypothetical protein